MLEKQATRTQNDEVQPIVCEQRINKMLIEALEVMWPADSKVHTTIDNDQYDYKVNDKVICSARVDGSIKVNDQTHIHVEVKVASLQSFQEIALRRQIGTEFLTLISSTNVDYQATFLGNDGLYRYAIYTRDYEFCQLIYLSSRVCFGCSGTNAFIVISFYDDAYIEFLHETPTNPQPLKDEFSKLSKMITKRYDCWNLCRAYDMYRFSCVVRSIIKNNCIMPVFFPTDVERLMKLKEI